MELETPVWVRSLDSGSWSWHACKIVGKKPNSKSADGKMTDLELGVEDRPHRLLSEDIPPWKTHTVVVNLSTLADDEDDSRKDAIRYRNEPSKDGLEVVEDLINLPHLNEPSILTTLRHNFAKDEVYTSNGPTLLALNPFKSMDIYGTPVLKSYQKAGASSNPEGRLGPHAFRVADDAYRAMLLALERNRSNSGGDTANQSILISGESGAGKTYTTKLCMKYLAVLSEGVVGGAKTKGGGGAATYDDASLSPTKKSSGSTREMRRASLIEPPKEAPKEELSVECRILQSNPILESFGNALTLRNDNSSRFGKYLEILFSSTGILLGAQVVTYLLEKVRLVPSRDGSGEVGERNYHVFYQFLDGMSNTERQSYGIDDDMSAKDFKILSMTSDSYTRYRDFVPDSTCHTDMVEAMTAMGFSGQMIADIVQSTYAVLLLGNVTFDSGNVGGEGESCTLKRDKWAEKACTLLSVSMDDFEGAVCFSNKKIGRDTIKKPLKPEVAKLANEAFMKALYSSVFDIVTESVNRSIASFDGTGDGILHVGSDEATIGVLDIFGFEHFKINSFEQLCINLANESLQQKFNETVFKKEQEEYVKEGISWNNIDFPDNDDVLELIDNRKPRSISLFAVLNEQCVVPKGSDQKFASALYKEFGTDKYPRFVASPKQKVNYQFTVDHYAGKVTYDTDGFLEKNKDSIGDAVTILEKSSLPFLSDEIKGRLGGVSKNFKDNAIARKFTKQLADLRGKLDSTQTSFIRCLKPTDQLIPDTFDSLNIVEQLRSSGVLSAVRVSRAGFSNRYRHVEFLSRYHMLITAHGKGVELMDAVTEVAIKINRHSNVVDASKFDAMSGQDKQIAIGMQLGKTKVFLRRKAFDQLEGTRTATVLSSVRKIQNAVRGKISRALFLKFRAKVVKSQTIVRMFLGKCRLIHKRKEYLKRIAHKIAAAIVLQRFVRSRNNRRRWVAVILETLRLSKIATADLEDELAKKADAEYLAACAKCDPDIQTELEEFGKKGMTEATVLHLSKMSKEKQVEAVRSLKRSQSQSVATTSSKKGLFGRKPQQPDPKKRRMSLNAGMNEILTDMASSNRQLNHATSKRTSRDSRDPATLLKDKRAREIEMTEWTKEKKLAKREGTLPPATYVPPAVVATKLGSMIEREQWAEVEQHLKSGGKEAVFGIEEDSLETCLHICARHPTCWSSIIEFIIVNGKGIEFQKDKNGWTPFHIASYSDETNEVLEYICEHSNDERKGASITNGAGELPLHIAAKGGAKHNVLVLCNIYGNEGARVQDSKGNLPLHSAAVGRGGSSLMKTLLQQNPDGASTENEKGKLPLRLALESEMFDPSIIKNLLSSNTDAVTADDLFLALDMKVSGDGLKIMLLRYVSADGDMSVIHPLDGISLLSYALSVGAADECISNLLEFNKAPALVEENGLMCVELAVSKSYSDATVSMLLNATVGHDAAFVRSWFHLCCNAVDGYVGVVDEYIVKVSRRQDREETLYLFKITCLEEDIDMEQINVSLKEITENDKKLCKASEKCEKLLLASLRFLGRYQQIQKLKVDKRTGTEIILADDFGNKGRANKVTQVVLKVTSDSSLVQREIEIRKKLCMTEGVTGVSAILCRVKNVHVNGGEFTITLERLTTIIDFVSKYSVKQTVVRKWAKSIATLIHKLNRCGYYHEEINMANCGRDINGVWKFCSAKSIKKLSSAPAPEKGKSPVHHKTILNLIRVIVLLYGMPKEEPWDLQRFKKNNSEVAKLLALMNKYKLPKILQDVIFTVAFDKQIEISAVLKMDYFKGVKKE